MLEQILKLKVAIFQKIIEKKVLLNLACIFLMRYISRKIKLFKNKIVDIIHKTDFK